MSDPKDEITPNDVLKIIESGKPVSIIDVREKVEVAAGKIPEARHIRMSEIPERLDELDENEEHIIVCRSGNRSGRVAKFLQSQGIRAKNMIGGMIQWEGDVSADE